MGLDVMVNRILKPTAKNLRSKRSRQDFECDHECELHYISDPKSVEKLQKAGFLLEWDDDDIIDWDATFAARGLVYAEWDWSYQDASGFGFFRKGSKAETEWEYDKNTDDFQVFHYEDIKTKLTHVTGICIGKGDLGYQRKGANAQFYKDGKWDDDTIVTTKEELLEDWDKYFGHSDEFKRNIVDNFVEGETVVLYW